MREEINKSRNDSIEAENKRIESGQGFSQSSFYRSNRENVDNFDNKQARFERINLASSMQNSIMLKDEQNSYSSGISKYSNKSKQYVISGSQVDEFR